MVGNLSPNFSVSEATESPTASRLEISNVPSLPILEVMRKTALGMELVRATLNSPIRISSWYRNLELNRALRSKDTSQHIKGEAVDFTSALFGSPLEIVQCLVERKDKIRFDQLILEHTWVHISFQSNPDISPRGEVLSLLAGGAYALGITDRQGRRSR